MASPSTAPSAPPSSLTLSCLCGSCNGTLTISSPSILPLRAEICHCADCRHVSGQIQWTTANIPPGSTLTYTGPQTVYATPGDLGRRFCSVCGCHLWEGVDDDSEKQSFCVGNIADGGKSGDGVFDYRAHTLVVTTGDGGFANWYDGEGEDEDEGEGDDGEAGKAQQSQLKTYTIDANYGEKCDLAELGASNRKRHEKTWNRPPGKEEKLYGDCHCGGVKFYITPPSTTCDPLNPALDHMPFSDSLKPYNSSSAWEKANPHSEKWWIRANGTKYLAGTCACRSCRLNSGMDIQTWAFVPRANIFWVSGQEQEKKPSATSLTPLPLDVQESQLGTLTAYNSSPGVYRHFCRVCGATVFWRSEKRRFEIIDVSIGLLRAEEGVLATRWLDWSTERVSFREDASNQDFVGRVEKGLRRWGKRIREDEEVTEMEGKVDMGEKTEVEWEDAKTARASEALAKKIDGHKEGNDMTTSHESTGKELADEVEKLDIQET